MSHNQGGANISNALRSAGGLASPAFTNGTGQNMGGQVPFSVSAPRTQTQTQNRPLITFVRHNSEESLAGVSERPGGVVNQGTPPVNQGHGHDGNNDDDDDGDVDVDPDAAMERDIVELYQDVRREWGVCDDFMHVSSTMYVCM
jgi:hypothetical protein